MTRRTANERTPFAYEHTPGPVWQWQYNAAGELVEAIGPMNRVTQFVHDGDGNVIQTIAPNLLTGGAGDASTTTFDTYDLDNEKLSETTPNGATTTWQVDDLGRIVKETQPVPQAGESAPVWQYQYDADSELTKVINPLNLSQTSTFNGMGQMSSQTSFAGVPTAWTYNNLSRSGKRDILVFEAGMGQMTTQTSFGGVPTAWTYNNLLEMLTQSVGSGLLTQHRLQRRRPVHLHRRQLLGPGRR